MVTIVRRTVPAAQFALNHSLGTLPDVEVECERIVRSGDDAVMPLLWVRYAARDEVEAAFEADPPVDNVTCLSDLEEELLYRMDWIDHVDLLLQMLTNAEATVLDAYGHGPRWKLRVLYPEREEFSTTHEFCAGHGLTFDVASIREIDGQPAGSASRRASTGRSCWRSSAATTRCPGGRRSRRRWRGGSPAGSAPLARAGRGFLVVTLDPPPAA